MPVLCWVTLKIGLVPSFDDCVKFIPNCSQARIYSALCGWYRELDAGIKLCQYGRVVKDFQLDLSEGVDWLVDGKRVAIVHQGRGSRYFYNTRKREKQDVDIVLVARSGAGVHLVDVGDIAERFGHPQSVDALPGEFDPSA